MGSLRHGEGVGQLRRRTRRDREVLGRAGRLGRRHRRRQRHVVLVLLEPDGVSDVHVAPRVARHRAPHADEPVHLSAPACQRCSATNGIPCFAAATMLSRLPLVIWMDKNVKAVRHHESVFGACHGQRSRSMELAGSTK
jgi:hypothetical protein